MNYLSEDFFEQAKKELKTRLDEKRFEHSVLVSKMAGELASIYGIDERKAKIAGLLHDWDKSYSDVEIKERARCFNVDVPEDMIDDMPYVLHAHTAARCLKERFPQIEPDVLQAIDRHTSAAIDMSDLDMLIYIADVLEPSRCYNDVEKVRSEIGKVSLEELFVLTYQHVFISLIKRNKRVHPQTSEVWNYYIMRQRQGSVRKGSL